MALRILKIKVSKKQGKVSIEYEDQNKKGDWDQYAMSCGDSPRPEMFKALESLRPILKEIGELLEPIKDLTVTGATFSYPKKPGEEGEFCMGCTIIGSKVLLNSNPDLNLSTPHKFDSPTTAKDAGDSKNLLPVDAMMPLRALQEEAKHYINGDRSQQDLFAKDKKKAAKIKAAKKAS